MATDRPEPHDHGPLHQRLRRDAGRGAVDARRAHRVCRGREAVGPGRQGPAAALGLVGSQRRGEAMTTADAAVDVGLEFEFEFHATVKPPVAIGPGPYGMRMYFETIEGDVIGERVSG